MVFKKGNKPTNPFPKGIYQGNGFKKENTLGFVKGHNRQKGSKNSRFKGKILRGGYWAIFIPDHPFATKAGRVHEHRLVMEKQLNRYLKREEVVHHINFNKLDNRIENLMLFATTRDHTIYHSFLRKNLKNIDNQDYLDKVSSQANKDMDN